MIQGKIEFHLNCLHIVQRRKHVRIGGRIERITEELHKLAKIR